MAAALLTRLRIKAPALNYRLTKLVAGFFFFNLVGLATPGSAAPTDRQQVCDWLTSTLPKTAIPGGYQIYDEAREQHIRVTFRPSQANWSVASIDFRGPQDRPELLVRLRQPCQILQARRPRYNATGKLISLHSLGPDLKTITAEEPVNPPSSLTSRAVQNKATLLAIADTGVNYLLPELQPHIARTSDGGLMGYDFWDEDDRPFDFDPRRNPYYPFHHGTTVFSVLAAEAPDEPVAIYRFPALDMCGYQRLIEMAVQTGIRILNLSMGSRSYDDWACFEAAARSAPAILFIVSAGNDGQNIDTDPVYPAALALENLFVVSSSDAFGRPGPTSNIGSRHVDILVPAEQLEVIDHRGVRTQTGGTSYAAPRIAALAVRYLRANPSADTKQIISFLKRRAIAAPGNVTAYGWIPDPTDNFGFSWRTPQ